MTTFNITDHPHRRFNILTGEWIQVSPHRAKRPWQGQVEDHPIKVSSSYDPQCYLCPGNRRSNGETNPVYEHTFCFENDFAAIVQKVPQGTVEIDHLLIAKSEKGICKVVCFSPRHDITIAEMSKAEIINIVHVWIREFRELSQFPYINYVQIFENKGSIMGCSNPHPHGQIWAQESIPTEPLKKDRQQRNYYAENSTTLLQDYLKSEEALDERIICQNEHFVVVVPFWATWPFETMIIPRRPMSVISEMTVNEIGAFADMIRLITVKYDNLFNFSFPYSAGIHQAPTDDNEYGHWHWHMIFYPPLLRSATIKKFMVGYEMFANPQRDITPEFSAAQLRSASVDHYRKNLFKYL
jgi:UDPglucose--hexose-1-phosphate uridylyltransferase